MACEAFFRTIGGFGARTEPMGVLSLVPPESDRALASREGSRFWGFLPRRGIAADGLKADCVAEESQPQNAYSDRRDRVLDRIVKVTYLVSAVAAMIGWLWLLLRGAEALFQF